MGIRLNVLSIKVLLPASRMSERWTRTIDIALIIKFTVCCQNHGNDSYFRALPTELSHSQTGRAGFEPTVTAYKAIYIAVEIPEQDLSIRRFTN